MRDRAERKNRVLQKQIRGSLPHSAGGGRGVGQGWVCCDGVILESQRGGLFAPPLSLWITVSMSLSQRAGD